MLAKKHNAFFFEASAKAKNNMDCIFDDITEHLKEKIEQI